MTAKKLAYDYDIAREELNLLCDYAEESSLSGVEVDRIKAKIRKSLDDCFEVATRLQALEGE